MDKIDPKKIQDMDYVSFMGFLDETNRPPGGKDSMRRMAQNAFLTSSSHVLHSGCNTGYCSFELSHIAKCKITAIDRNDFMIASAKKRLANEPLPYRKLITFKKGDARKLQFNDNSFDLVMSGGSTAFMDNRDQVVREYQRVCKPYGFVGDVVLYYHKDPPKQLISQINKALNITIQKWSKDDWINLYTKAGLETYYIHDSKMPFYPSASNVRTYCEQMVKRLSLNPASHAAAVKKLNVYMTMFNENHRYLSYAVLLFRKTPREEQITLFGS